MQIEIGDFSKINPYEKESLIKDIQIKKWNENIKNIPQIDEHTLEGIDHWYVHRFKMIPNTSKLEYGKHNQVFRDEAEKLVNAGFDLAFNEDHGVGNILIEENKKEIGEEIIIERMFTVELWQNLVVTRIHKETLDEVLDWILYFHFYKHKKTIKDE